MGRFNLRVRPVYSDADQLTWPEKFAQGVQGGLDWYAARRETARTEGNEVGARGGVRLPDAPTPSIRQRIGGIGRRIGEVIHGSAGEPPVLPPLQPTGTYAPTRYPGETRSRGDFMPDEEAGEVPGMPDPDDITRDAIMGANRVVPPMQPVGALPSSVPRPSAGPMLYDQQGAQGMPGIPPERTFEYQGSDGSRYQMPQTGERERSARMLEYGVKEGIDSRNDERTATREYEHDERMRDIYAQRDATRGEQQAAHDARVESMRSRLARLTRAGAGNSPEALSIRAKLAEIAAQREARLGVQQGINAERGAAAIEGKAIQTDASQIVKDPLDRRMLQRDPKAAAANAAREARVEQGVAGLRGSASRVRAAVTKANAPPSRPDLPSARTEEARLIRQGLAKEDARAAMRAAGWPIK